MTAFIPYDSNALIYAVVSALLFDMREFTYRCISSLLEIACVPARISCCLSTLSIENFCIASGFIANAIENPTGISFRSIFSPPTCSTYSVCFEIRCAYLPISRMCFLRSLEANQMNLKLHLRTPTDSWYELMEICKH